MNRSFIAAGVAVVLVTGLVAGCARPEAEEAEPDMALATRQFREAARHHGFEVTGVDASSAECLEAMLADRRIVRICWEDMGRDTKASAESLDRKLTRLKVAMQSDAGMTRTRFDATLTDRVTVPHDREAPSDTPSPTPSQRIHVTEEGEDLYSIAMMWGVSVAALKEANGMDSAEIRPGERIVIPLDN